VGKIKAKFRRRNGVPYAVETFSGRQFRCRHCNEIFNREKELATHLRIVGAEHHGEQIPPHRYTPRLSTSIQATVLYTYDIADRMKKQWLKLKKFETYDGL
jgi:uncharacterized C2H2 Zn-finger protein